MTDRHTLAETEAAMQAHVAGLAIDLPAAEALSSLYRAANAVRNHLTNTVLRPHELTWTGFVVLWVVWIWDDIETRHAAESAAISKATLTGVVTTLEGRGWLTRETDDGDRRRVRLRLTDDGRALMQRLYPQFNAAEAEVVGDLPARSVTDLARSLRAIVTSLEQRSETSEESAPRPAPAR